MKRLNLAIAIIFILGVLCFVAKFVTELFDATKTTVEKDGYLKEPFFFLIPIGWLLILIGVALFTLKIVGNRTKRKP